MDFAKLNALPYFMETFQTSARRWPQQPMFVDEKHPEGITRSAVDECSARVYAYLKGHGIGREDMVMICLPRGAEIIIAAIGVWKAGAACVLAEDDLPAERLAFIREDSESKLTIDSALWPEIMRTAPLDGFVQADDHDAAFAIYTSGSTGTPKGVLQEYGCFRMQALSMSGVTISPETAHAETMTSPFYALAGVSFFIRHLYTLDTVHILSNELSRDPMRFNRYLAEHNIAQAFLPPSALRVIGSTLSPTVRHLVVGGEGANGLSLEGVILENGYSLSEAGFPLCSFFIDHPYDLCPVGKPTTDLIRLRLLDEAGREVPPGKTGEICFDNPFFRGYINLPDETRSAFRGGVFHSGDLGKWDENGNLVITGRANEMLKIGGNRVEPGEIERVFRKLTGQDWCAVRGFTVGTRTLLCLYYQGEDGLNVRELREAMRASLPDYMIPARFQRVETVPLLASGKTDKAALPEPDWFENRPAYVPPETEEERTLCRAFEAVFEIAPVGLDDDFFDLGGDSVAAMAVMAEADLPGLSVLDIFEGRTLRCILEKQVQRLDEEYEEDYAASEARERAVDHPLPGIVYPWLKLTHTGDTHFPGLLRFDQSVDAQRLCDALNRAVANRSLLSMIIKTDGVGRQVFHYDSALTPHYEVQKMTQAEFDALRPGLLTTFEIYGAPLIHAGVYETEQSVYLFVDVHHMIMDGSAMSLLYGDIEKAYRGERLSQDTYATYLARLERECATERYQKSKEAWMQLFNDENWHSDFGPDRSGGPDKIASQPCRRMIAKPEAHALTRRLRVSENLLFVGLTFLALTKLEGEGNYLCTSGYHNRSDTLCRNAFGLLLAMPIITSKARKSTSLAAFFAGLKASWIESLATLQAATDAMGATPRGAKALTVTYETMEAAGGSVPLSALGAQKEEMQQVLGGNMINHSIWFYERPKVIVPVLLLNTAFYSPERQQAILDALAEVIDRLVALEDPERTTVGELLE